MNYYDAISKGYEELHREEQENKIALIKANFEFAKDMKILDVGAGPGFLDVLGKITRIDPSEELLKLGGDNYVVGVAEDLPFENDSFDVVVSLTAMQNFTDLAKAIFEMKRVCKKDFILTFLKKSQKSSMLCELVEKHFEIVKKIDEDKDFIYIAKYK